MGSPRERTPHLPGPPAATLRGRPLGGAAAPYVHESFALWESKQGDCAVNNHKAESAKCYSAEEVERRARETARRMLAVKKPAKANNHEVVSYDCGALSSEQSKSHG